MTRALGLLALVLAAGMGLAACGDQPAPAEPTAGPSPTPSATPCPLSTTPERSMQAEAAQVEGALSGAGIAARVSATGLNHCPGQPAETVAWFEIALPADDPADQARLRVLAEAVIDSVNAWPEAYVYVTITHANAAVARLEFSVAEARLSRDQDLTGADLLAALGYRLLNP